MRYSGGQQEKISRGEHGELLFPLPIEIKESKLAFELVKDFVAWIDVKIFSPVRPARDERNEIRILPDDAPLSPLAAVFIDPLLEIEPLKMWEHRTSSSRGYYRFKLKL